MNIADYIPVPPRMRADVLGRGYAWCRTLIAGATLLTLLTNSGDVLFAPVTAAGAPSAPGWNAQLFLSIGPELWRWVAIATLALVCTGWRPRVTGVLHWWVASSLFQTATATDGGEQVAAALTLLLVPLTLLDPRPSHWRSLAPMIGSRAECLRVVRSMIVLAISLQIAVIYFHAAVGKMGVEDWSNGTALYYWFQHGHVAMHPSIWDPVGRWIFSDSTLLPLLTWSVMLFELGLALTLFAAPPLRRAVFVPAVAFHIGILLLHGITSFSLTMIGVLCIYLLPARGVPTTTTTPWTP